MWCIPPKENAAFVCQMESVLEVYKRPVSESHPVVCMDETSKQCTKEVRESIPASPGHPERYDSEYQRNGVAHIILFHAPFRNWRRIHVDNNHKAPVWAEQVRRLVEEDFPEAQKITLVMDNLNIHSGASLYKAFPPEKARELLNKIEMVFTPKHGSWLNIAECEFSALSRQCLDRCLPDIDSVREEVCKWVEERNATSGAVEWQFTAADARIKLKRLYPKI